MNLTLQEEWFLSMAVRIVLAEIIVRRTQ